MKKLHKTVLATTIGLSCFGVYADSIKPESKVVQPDGSPIGFKYKIGTQSPYSKEFRNIRLPVYPGSKIVVLPSFVNESDNSLTNGDVLLDANGNVAVTQASVMVADVASKSEGQADEFLKVKIPEDYVCGLPGEVEPFEIDLTAKGTVDGKQYIVEEKIKKYVGMPEVAVLGKASSIWFTGKELETEVGDIDGFDRALFEPVIKAQLKVAANGSIVNPDSIQGLKLTLRTAADGDIVLFDQLNQTIPLKDRILALEFPQNQAQRKELSEKLNGKMIKDGGIKLIWETNLDGLKGNVKSTFSSVVNYLCPSKPIIHDPLLSLYTSAYENETLSFTPRIYNNRLSENQVTYKWSLVQSNGLTLRFKEEGKELSFKAPEVAKDTTVKFKLVATNNFGMISEKTFDFEIKNQSTPPTDPKTDTKEPETDTKEPETDTKEPEVSTPPKTQTKPKAKSSGGDGGGSIFYLIAGLFGLLQMRRRS